MSDPMRPANVQLTSRQKSLRVAPDATLIWNKRHLSERGRLKKIPEVQELLSGTRLKPKHSVVLNPSLHAEEHVQKSTEVKMATTKAGPGTARRRSLEAKTLANAGFYWLPDEHEYASKGIVYKRMDSTVKIESPGTVMTLHRLAKYIPSEDAKMASYRPVTEEEAEEALKACGLSLFDNGVVASELKPKELTSTVPGQAVRVSRHSYNGLPTESNSDDTKAMEICVDLARKISVRLNRAEDEDDLEGVKEWYDTQRKRRPYLTTLMGRAKEDCYPTNKIQGMELRFYTAWPRPLQLLIQSMGQAFDTHKQGVFQDTADKPRHSFTKCSLAHGGAEKLVSVLQAQLDRAGWACVVCGDDSWVVILLMIRGKMFMVRLSIDCSSFDLTQLGYVTLQVHKQLYAEYRLVQKAYAALWFCMMRERDICVDKTLVYEAKDMGTSGGFGQSDVNSMLAYVLCKRLEVYLRLQEASQAGLWAEPSATPAGVMADPGSPRRDHDIEPADVEEYVSNAFVKIARRMGFTGRVEDAFASEARTVKEQLNERPFLFVGYYFHIENGVVRPFCDLARSMAQLVYPSGPKLADSQMFSVLEGMRLAGVVINMGVPPLELARSYEAMRVEAAHFLREALAILDGRDEGIDFDPTERFSNFLVDNPWGATLPSNVEGLLSMLLFGTEDVWLKGPSTNPFDEAVGSKDHEYGFKAASDESTAIWEELLGVQVPHLNEAVLKPATTAAVDERPATKRTHGRPPPIVTAAELAQREVDRQEKQRQMAIQREAKKSSYRNPFDDDDAQAEDEPESDEDDRDFGAGISSDEEDEKPRRRAPSEDSLVSIPDSPDSGVSIDYDEATFGDAPMGSHKKTAKRAHG